MFAIGVAAMSEMPRSDCPLPRNQTGATRDTGAFAGLASCDLIWSNHTLELRVPAEWNTMFRIGAV